MSYDIKPIHTLTADEIRKQGALAAERGEGIYEAEIRSGLDGDSLLLFEEGYFAHNPGRTISVPEQMSG